MWKQLLKQFMFMGPDKPPPPTTKVFCLKAEIMKTWNTTETQTATAKLLNQSLSHSPMSSFKSSVISEQVELLLLICLKTCSKYWTGSTSNQWLKTGPTHEQWMSAVILINCQDERSNYKGKPRMSEPNF